MDEQLEQMLKYLGLKATACKLGSLYYTHKKE